MNDLESRQIQLAQQESSQKQHHNEIQHQEKLNVIIMQQEYLLFSMLKPKVYIDGNQYCVLHGEDLQVGVAGFGNTLNDAILDFNKSFYKPVYALSK